MTPKPLADCLERVYPDIHAPRRFNGVGRGRREYLPSNVKAIAELSGLNERTIYRLFTSDSVRPTTIDEICTRVLHIHPHQLYGDEWTHKVCSCCGEFKNLEHYEVRNTGKHDFFSSRCDSCRGRSKAVMDG